METFCIPFFGAQFTAAWLDACHVARLRALCFFNRGAHESHLTTIRLLFIRLLAISSTKVLPYKKIVFFVGHLVDGSLY